jgi:hypothetical protein
MVDQFLFDGRGQRLVIGIEDEDREQLRFGRQLFRVRPSNSGNGVCLNLTDICESPGVFQKIGSASGLSRCVRVASNLPLSEMIDATG